MEGHRRQRRRSRAGDRRRERAQTERSGAAAAQGEPAAEPLSEEERARLRQELKAAEAELKQLQGESPLVHFCVNSQAIAETVSAWTGIPLGRMVADELKTVLNLKALMEQSLVGQSHALEVIAQSIRTSRANLADPRPPDRRVPAGRHQRRRQDRNRHHAWRICCTAASRT